MPEQCGFCLYGEKHCFDPNNTYPYVTRGFSSALVPPAQNTGETGGTAATGEGGGGSSNETVAEEN